MALTTAGATLIAQCLMDDSPTFLTNANAHLGVGDSNTAFNVAQTDLQAATNKVRKPMEASYPQRSANATTYRSVFGTSDANFTWNEWGVFNASSGGTMAGRKVESLGAKTNAASWQLTAVITLTAS